jgi:hypothetical protein
MPVWQLVLDGVQLVESWRRISKGVGDFDAIFHVASATEVEWSRLNLESGPTELLTILSEPTPIADVCERASIDAFDTCRYLWAFRSLEWIEPAEISVETAAELAERAETVAPSPAPNLATTVVNLEPPPPIPQRLLVTQVSAAKTPEVPKTPPQSSPATTRPEVQPPPSPAPALHHTQLFIEPPPEPSVTPPSTTGELMEAILDGRGDVPAPVSKPPEPEAPEAPPDSATRFFPGASALAPHPPPEEEDFFEGSPEFASMSLDYALSSPPELPPPETQGEPALSSFAEVAHPAEVSEAEMPLIEATVLEDPAPLPPQLVTTQPSIPTSPEAPSGLELFAMNDPFAAAEAAAPPPTTFPTADPLPYADASIAAALPSRPKTDELDLDIGHFFTGDDRT